MGRGRHHQRSEMAARKSRRKRNLSLKAELNARVESKARVLVVNLTKNKVASRPVTPAPSQQPSTQLSEGQSQGTVQLSSKAPRKRKRLSSDIQEEVPRKRKRLSNEIQEEEDEVKEVEPAKEGCGLYKSVLEEHKELCAMFPGRLFQIGLLLKLLSGDSLPPCLYVHGSSSTGKTSTLSAVLSRLQLKYTMINCKECFYPQLLFAEILNGLSNSDSEEERYRCSSVNSFLTVFKQLPCFQSGSSLCIVLDNAEHLRSDPVLLTALKRLAGLVGSCRVCVVMISVITMHMFFGTTPAAEVFPIHFTQYSKEESLQIMLLDCPTQQPLPFYQTFVHHIWNVFSSVCRDLAELRHLSSSLFPKYVEPVEGGDIGHGETRRLWKHIEPYFRTVMNRVYLRESSLSDLDSVTTTSSSSTLTELPYHSKYLLLASFLASYNPSRVDRRFFSKLKQPKLRKPHGHRAPKEQSLQELGPKEFGMDRMMAIFHSITTYAAPHISSQLSSLVHLQLLAQTSKSDALDCPRYKCLIDLATAQQLAKCNLIHLNCSIWTAMLSLAPLSGLQAAIKRRNSKVARRDSISIEHSNLALPGTIRRFSSTEALNSQTSAPPSVATVSRISSFSRKIRKISTGNPAQTELVDSCNVLDLHIAQIKRKLAEFREEDVDISERVEELTSTVGDLCQDYRIQVDATQSLPRLHSYFHVLHGTENVQDLEEDYLEPDEEEFRNFCQTHNYLLGRNPQQFGYSTLPLPPTRGGERKTVAPVAPHPKRSQSYEGHHLRAHDNYATLSFRPPARPRNSYPQSFNGHDDSYQHKRLQFQSSCEGRSYRQRPLSYQDISYDENDYEGNSTDGSWSELSCP